MLYYTNAIYSNLQPTLDQHPCANSDITIFSQHWTNIHAPTAILQYSANNGPMSLYQRYIFQHSANIGPTSMRQQRYYNIQPTLDQHPYANSDIVPSTFNQHIAPMSLCHRYTNIRPTLDQHPCANSDITIFSQHWTNIPTPTAILCLQHLTNIEPMSLCQRYTNIRPTLDQHPCANSDITIFSQHWTNIHAPTAILQYSANIGPTSMRQQRYSNIQPTLDQHPCANSDITIFSQHWTNIPTPTAILCLQHLTNIAPMSLCQRYTNIRPTLDQHPCANSHITIFSQHWTNIPTPTAILCLQHLTNIEPMSLCQRYTNIRPTLDQHPCANSDITIFSQHWTNIHAPTAILQYSANNGPMSLYQRYIYSNIQPTLDQHPCANRDITIFSQHWTNIHAPTAILQYSANNGPMSLYQRYIFQHSANIGPTYMRQQRYYNLFSQHWASIHAPTAILQPIQPTLGHHSCANCNIQPTLGQQYCANGDVTTLSQHWANIIVFAGPLHLCHCQLLSDSACGGCDLSAVNQPSHPHPHPTLVLAAGLPSSITTCC